MPKQNKNNRQAKPRNRSKNTPKTKLEELYPLAFRVNLDFSQQKDWSLEQPSPLKYVESTTTYGVFETQVK